MHCVMMVRMLNGRNLRDYFELGNLLGFKGVEIAAHSWEIVDLLDICGDYAILLAQ